MKEPVEFWLGFALLAVMPLATVGLFALERRFSSGVPPRDQRTLWAAALSFYVAGGVYFFSTGELFRGTCFLGSGVSVAYLLNMRRQASVQPTRRADQ